MLFNSSRKILFVLEIVFQIFKFFYFCLFPVFSLSAQPRLQHIFSLQEGGKKEAVEKFKHVTKICPNRGHILQNKLRNIWAAMLKTSAVLLLRV